MTMICINVPQQLVILWTPNQVERMELETAADTVAMHQQIERDYQLLYGWPESGEFVYQMWEVGDESGEANTTRSRFTLCGARAETDGDREEN